MPIQLRPMLPADMPAEERIMSGAFSHGLRPYIYPNGLTNADHIHNCNEVLSSLSKLSTSDTQAGARIMVAYDTDAPAPSSDFYFPKGFELKAECELGKEQRREWKRVVGIAVYQLQPHKRTQADLDGEAAEGANRPMSPSANAALLERFGEALSASRAKHIGTAAYLYLKILAVDPEYQRQGVGSVLLDWGMDIADRVGIQSYLEASEVGRALYRRYGFAEKGWVEGFDIREFVPEVGEEEHRFMCMVRPAREKAAHERREEQGDGEGSRRQGGNEVVVEKAE